jgi:hypothetical protein
MGLVSSCCGAGDISFEDYGICPDCREHCEFVDEDTLEEL